MIPNQFLIFRNSTCNPPKFPKKLHFSHEKFHSNGINGSTFSTQLVSTTLKSGSNWRQRLQSLHQISVNNSKICTKLVSTAPNIYGTWSWHWFDQDFGAVDANLIQILESLTPIRSRFWKCWHFSDFDFGVVDTNWVEKVEPLMPFEWNFSWEKSSFLGI